MKLYAWLVVLASCHVNIFEWHLPWHLVKIEKNFFIIKIFVEPIALNVVDKLLQVEWSCFIVYIGRQGASSYLLCVPQFVAKLTSWLSIALCVHSLIICLYYLVFLMVLFYILFFELINIITFQLVDVYFWPCILFFLTILLYKILINYA